MQVIILISIFLTIATIIIYKINDKFEKREFVILLIAILFSTIGFLFYENNKENHLPNLFLNKYENENNIKIKSLDYELLNNKVVSSKDEFIYKFTYTIIKENSEYLCTLNNVKINKVKDEYIFINFSDLKEECLKK